MKLETVFNAAYARFKDADANVAKLTTKLEQAKARRVEAAMSSAAADTDVNQFATGTEFDPDKAANIVLVKQKSEAVLDLLDRGIDHLANELAGSKIDLIAAERECASAQAAFHDSVLDEQTHKWLRANAKSLQSLCQQLHYATIFALTSDGGPRTEYPPVHVEHIFLNVLPRLISNEFGEDEDFRSGCQATLTGATINRVCASPNIDDGERSVVANHRNDRSAHVAALRERWQPQEEPEQQLDPYRATMSLADQRDRANRIRQRIQELDEQISTFEKKSPQAMNLTMTLAIDQKKAERDNVRVELERIESNCRSLEQKLTRQAA
jgi:hypothetical protein